MPDRVFDVQKHPRRAAYTMLILCVLVIFAFGSAAISAVQHSHDQTARKADEVQIAALRAKVDTQEKTAVIACRSQAPKTRELLRSLKIYYHSQLVSSQGLLSGPTTTPSGREFAQRSIRNYQQILVAIDALLPIRC